MGKLFDNAALTTPGSALLDSGGNAVAVGNPSQVRDQLFRSSANFKPFADIQPGTPIVPGQSPLDKVGIGTPSFSQAENAGPAPGGTNALSPGLQKLGNTPVFLRAGAEGALAGRAAQEETIAASGGRRAGGVGTGFTAGYQLPFLRAATQQNLQRGSLENQLLQNQVSYAPYLNFLNAYKAQSEIGKNNAEAGKFGAEAQAVPIKSQLEQAQALAARYKEDPGTGQLVDLQSGQPFGNANGLAPLSAEEASVLGKQEGDRVPIKLKNTASEIVNRGVRTVQANGRSLLVDNQGNTIKDLGVATPLSVINANMGAFGNVDSPQVQAMVDQVGQGKIDLPTALSSMRRNPAAAANFMGALLQKYPDFNQAQFGVSKKTMEYFTTGQGANELNAFRTAIAHADLLGQAAQALQNKDTRAYNTVKNALKTQFGDPEPSNFNVISNAYTREVTKALSAGHITDNEVKTQGATIPTNASLQQITGAVDAYKNLMLSKARLRMDQYENGIQGKPAFPTEILNNNSQGGANRPPLSNFEH